MKHTFILLLLAAFSTSLVAQKGNLYITTGPMPHHNIIKQIIIKGNNITKTEKLAGRTVFENLPYGNYDILYITYFSDTLVSKININSRRTYHDTHIEKYKYVTDSTYLSEKFFSDKKDEINILIKHMKHGHFRIEKITLFWSGKSLKAMYSKYIFEPLGEITDTLFHTKEIVPEIQTPLKNFEKPIKTCNRKNPIQARVSFLYNNRFKSFYTDINSFSYKRLMSYISDAKDPMKYIGD